MVLDGEKSVGRDMGQQVQASLFEDRESSRFTGINNSRGHQQVFRLVVTEPFIHSTNMHFSPTLCQVLGTQQ